MNNNNNYFKVIGFCPDETFGFDDTSKQSAQQALRNAQTYRDTLSKGGKIVVYKARGFGRIRGVTEIGAMPRERGERIGSQSNLIGLPRVA